MLDWIWASCWERIGVRRDRCADSDTWSTAAQQVNTPAARNQPATSWSHSTGLCNKGRKHCGTSMKLCWCWHVEMNVSNNGTENRGYRGNHSSRALRVSSGVLVSFLVHPSLFEIRWTWVSTPTHTNTHNINTAQLKKWKYVKLYIFTWQNPAWKSIQITNLGSLTKDLLTKVFKNVRCCWLLLGSCKCVLASL